MYQNYITYGVIVLMIVLETLGLLLLKSYNKIYIGIGVILFAFVALGFNYLIKEKGLSLGHALFDVITVIIISSIGILYFKEELTHKKLLGLLLAIISVYLIESH